MPLPVPCAFGDRLAKAGVDLGENGSVNPQAQGWARAQGNFSMARKTLIDTGVAALKPSLHELGRLG